MMAEEDFSDFKLVCEKSGIQTDVVLETVHVPCYGPHCLGNTQVDVYMIGVIGWRNILRRCTKEVFSIGPTIFEIFIFVKIQIVKKKLDIRILRPST